MTTKVTKTSKQIIAEAAEKYKEALTKLADK